MSTDLISLQAKLVKGKLPVLDATLEQFKKVSEQQNTTHQHLAEIIRSDIGFTLAMFRNINSSLPAGRDPVASVEHAISMNGVPRTLTIGEELVHFSSLSEEAQKHLKSLYSQSMHASQYFNAMAIQSRLPNPAESTKNIKLINLAEVLLWTNQPDVIASYKSLKGIGSNTVPGSLLDLSMRGLGLGIARDLKLPDDLQEALSPYDESNSLAMTMITATEIARQTSFNWHSEDYKALLEFWQEQTETPTERFENSLHQLAADTARQIHGRDLPQPAFCLFFEAPIKAEPEPESEPESEQAPEAVSEPKPKAEAKPKQAKPDTSIKAISEKINDQIEKVESLDKKPTISTQKSPAKITEKAIGKTIEKPIKEPIEKPPEKPVGKPAEQLTGKPVEKKVSKKTAAKSNPLQTIMTEKMRDMQQICGVDRVMFAMLTADRKKLVVKYMLGGDKQDALRKYQLDLSEKTLCSIMMKKPQSAHLNRSNYKKYLQLIPEHMQQSLNYKNMFAMSLFVKGKPLGMFVCDNRDNDLNTNHYNNFKKICNQTAELLSGKKS